jgi:hypothetical protein
LVEAVGVPQPCRFDSTDVSHAIRLARRAPTTFSSLSFFFLTLKKSSKKYSQFLCFFFLKEKGREDIIDYLNYN